MRVLSELIESLQELFLSQSRNTYFESVLNLSNLFWVYEYFLRMYFGFWEQWITFWSNLSVSDRSEEICEKDLSNVAREQISSPFGM